MYTIFFTWINELNWNWIGTFWKTELKILLLSPTYRHEIALIISSLDSTKSVRPNSILTKILKLLKNDISCQLADIFNMSITSGVFPFVLKIAKVVPVHKKDLN